MKITNNKDEVTNIKAHKMKVLAQQSAPNVFKGPPTNTSTTRNLVSSTRIGSEFSKGTELKDYKLSHREEMDEGPTFSNINKLHIKDVYGDTAITLKISSKMETRQVFVPSNLEMSVKEFKEKFFEKEINTEGMGVRLINNGKEMRDSHKLKDHVITSSNTVYVFFFKKEDKVRRETSLASQREAENLQNVTDTDGLDFDYFKERQNLTVGLYEMVGRGSGLEEILFPCSFHLSSRYSNNK